MNNDYWGGSRNALRSSAAYAGQRSGLNSGFGGADAGSSGRGGGYMTLLAAFAVVAAGSTGAALLAMSLLGGEPTDASAAPESAVRASVMGGPNRPEAQPQPAEASASPAVAEQPADRVEKPLALTAADLSPSSSGDGTDVSTLQRSDPRWAAGVAPAQSIENLLQSKAEVADAFSKVDTRQGAAAVARALDRTDDAGAGQTGDDAVKTAAIAVPPKPAPKPEQAPAALPSGKPATLNTDSNLRSRGSKSSSVIGTVPSGASVQLIGCKSSWCQIVYKGRNGYVYEGFIVGAGAASARRASAPASASPAPKPEPGPAAAASGLPGVSSNKVSALPVAR